MSFLESIRSACLVAWKTKGEEGELNFEDLFLDEYTDEDLARLYLQMDEWRKATNLAASVVDREWVKRWRNLGRGIEVDGFLVTAKKGYVKEDCHDENGFWEAARNYPIEVIRHWFNPNTARKGSLPPPIRDTFYRKEQTFKPDAVEVPLAIPTEVLNDR